MNYVDLLSLYISTFLIISCSPDNGNSANCVHINVVSPRVDLTSVIKNPIEFRETFILTQSIFTIKENYRSKINFKLQFTTGLDKTEFKVNPFEISELDI